MNSQPIIEPRPKSLSQLMLVPAFFALFLVAATLLLLYKISQNEIADGDRVQISMQGECLPSAQEIMDKRIAEIGLGAPVWSFPTEQTADLVVTLPNIPNAKESIPHLLTQRGVWEMRSQGEVVLSNIDIVSVELSLDEGGMPEVLLEFVTSAQQKAQDHIAKYPDQVSELWLDDKKIIDRPNSIRISEGFRLVSEESNPKMRMQESADFVILLSNPVLPCVITVPTVSKL